jgi:hypothetical protein
MFALEEVNSHFHAMVLYCWGDEWMGGWMMLKNNILAPAGN